MEPWQDRLIKEKEELEDKIKKLTYFMASDAYNDLHELDRSLLFQQRGYMNNYLKTLKERISRFQEPDEHILELPALFYPDGSVKIDTGIVDPYNWWVYLAAKNREIIIEMANYIEDKEALGHRVKTVKVIL
jgi:hypothetical protein